MMTDLGYFGIKSKLKDYTFIIHRQMMSYFVTLTEDDALKTCNFAEICRKMRFACYHGNINYLV